MGVTAKRLPTPDEGRIPEGLDTRTISYWRVGILWYLYLPGGGLGNLAGHEVTEHENGTITVSPSILVTNGNDRRRHGHLRRGVWEPCGDDVDPLTGEDDG